MKTLSDHITSIHHKPRHVRKQIAFGFATLVSLSIAFIWFIGSYMTGSFAIAGSSFADAVGQSVSPVAVGDGGYRTSQGLAGAAAALTTKSDTAARLEVVDTQPIVASQQTSEPAILPF